MGTAGRQVGNRIERKILMQLTLRHNDLGWARQTATTLSGVRARTVAAGIAVVGASVIAAVPAIQHPAGPQHRDVQLVNSGDIIEVLGSAAANLAERQTEIAASDLPATLTGLTTEYSTRISESFAESGAALQSAIAQFPTVLQEVSALYAEGNALEAFTDLNGFFLRQGLGGIGRPLFDLLDSTRPDGTGGVGIIGELSQLSTNVTQQLFSVETFRGASYALLAPSITAGFRASLETDAYTDQLEAGDTAGALNTLFQAPVRILDAFLNGDNFDGTVIDLEDEPFPGIFTEAGPIDFFFRILPDSIAEALGGPSGGDAAAAATDLSLVEDVTSIFDASSLFDASSWLDASSWFDVSSWFDEGMLLAAIDPGDIINAVTAELAI
ncbi:hypothetical protein PT015_20040 [Candidatus Mycobacterium wuenschmannii]|uniref:PE-PGRS family protein n=1 Tax=Candidatus Mycobacterium wuenschmannii TaxID=3027808 RepID=A0ABY8VU40_9MYCO|nr:hypothetical protein [Candidatus Mycobacterium wuenschmannii]WIM87133.1 hypothetical protein PT015_20040 [Candidatus Mycobacterium wuenschmannii]